MELCPNCDSDDVTIDREVDEFAYGLKVQVTLYALVDMYSCGSCGLKYTGVQGELARTEAVRAWQLGGFVLCQDEGCPQQPKPHYCRSKPK